MGGEAAHWPTGLPLSSEWRPPQALSAAQRRRVLWFLAGVSFAIALAFAWIGAWPVLPFAGLEVGVLVWAFREIERHADDYERLIVDGDRLVVEQKSAERLVCHEFNRHWARLVAEHDRAGLARLALCSHGRELVLGRALGPPQREALEKTLQSLLRR